MCLLALAASARAEEKSGEQIYKEMCARCHGAKGEGTKKYEQPLTGDKSVARLAKVIDRTMPEDDPDKLDAAQSKKVAEYIHDAFYSPVAQAKLNPPRVELARLTVRQYRNAVADLIGSFRAGAEARRQARASRRVLQRAQLPERDEGSSTAPTPR